MKEKIKVCKELGRALRSEYKNTVREVWSDYLPIEDLQFYLKKINRISYEIARFKDEDDKKSESAAARAIIYAEETPYQKYERQIKDEISLLTAHLHFICSKEQNTPDELAKFEREYKAVEKRIGYNKSLLLSVQGKELVDTRRPGRPKKNIEPIPMPVAPKFEKTQVDN